jgi:hypothetical protein
MSVVATPVACGGHNWIDGQLRRYTAVLVVAGTCAFSVTFFLIAVRRISDGRSYSDCVLDGARIKRHCRTASGQTRTY